MVKARKKASIQDEFAGGLLPGLSAPVDSKPNNKIATQARKKVTLYLDNPSHLELMDDLLTQLRQFGLPRDNSMLIRALLEQARAVLTDQERLSVLAQACQNTLPNR